MKIVSNNGHLKFYPKDAFELEKLSARTNINLVPEDDYFTVAALKNFPRFSIMGQPIEGTTLVATATIEGSVEDVLKANRLTIDTETMKVIPFDIVTDVASFVATSTGFYAGYLPQPYSFVGLKRLKAFTAFLNIDTMKYNIVVKE